MATYSCYRRTHHAQLVPLPLHPPRRLLDPLGQLVPLAHPTPLRNRHQPLWPQKPRQLARHSRHYSRRRQTLGGYNLAIEDPREQLFAADIRRSGGLGELSRGGRGVRKDQDDFGGSARIGGECETAAEGCGGFGDSGGEGEGVGGGGVGYFQGLKLARR